MLSISIMVPYDPRALEKINKLFRDRHADVVGEIDPELIDYMVDIRTRLGLPQTIVFKVLSGYRTPETNAMLAQHNKNVAMESTHMHGWAVDFRIDDVDGRAICGIARTMQRGGVAYYPHDKPCPYRLRQYSYLAGKIIMPARRPALYFSQISFVSSWGSK